MKNSPLKYLTILSWNAQSILNKKPEFTHLLFQKNIDVVCLCETFLKPHQDFRIPHYTIYRTDRLTQGGGTAILVKNSLQHQELHLPNPGFIESTSIIVFGPNNTNILISSCYKPPRHPLHGVGIDRVLPVGLAAVALGDFNAKHRQWNSNVTNPSGISLLDHVTSCPQMRVHAPHEPTRIPPNMPDKPDILDIAISNNWHYPSDINVLHELTSDHLPIPFSTEFHIQLSQPYPTKVNYNWSKFRQILIDTPPVNPPATSDDIDAEASNIQTFIQSALTASIKSQSYTPKFHRLPLEITQIITQRNRIRRQYQTYRLAHLKTQWNRLNRLIQNEILKHRRDSWDNIVRSAARDNLWKLPGLKPGRRRAIPPLDPNPFNPQTNAEVLAASYEKQFSPHFPPPDHRARLYNYAHQNTPTLPSGPEIIISSNNVTKIIKRLKNRAPGPDQIPNFALQMLPPPTIERLTNLYNSVFQLRHFPATWKIAKIVPGPKPGKNPKLPDSYRPISLLNTTSKILESLILEKITDHVTEHNLLNHDQFGFRRGHSTTLQLCRIADVVTTNFSTKRITAMVCLDLSKAFDTVYQDAMVFRLHKLDLPVRLIQLIRNYLSHKTFYVHCNNVSSSRHPITAGVPQGSALGLFLFSLYINNISKFTDHRIFNDLYVDDAAVVATSPSTDVLQNILQPHLDRLYGFFLSPPQSQS